MEDSEREVQLIKTSEGLGIAVKTAIVGGKRWPQIGSIRPGSVAAATPNIIVGDRIKSVNGLSVEGQSHQCVKQLLQLIPAPSTVTLLLLDPPNPSEVESFDSLSSGGNKRAFLPKSPSLESPSSSIDGHREASHYTTDPTKQVRRSHSERLPEGRHRIRLPISPPWCYIPSVSRSNSILSKQPPSGLAHISHHNQSTEGINSSGLGDSIGSLSSLSRQDTSELWPECGEYGAIGTDLHYAVVQRNVDDVTRLLKSGCSIYALDSNGDSPVDLASRAAYSELLELMEQLYEHSISSSSSISSSLCNNTSVEEKRERNKKIKMRNDVRKELAKVYENIGSKV